MLRVCSALQFTLSFKLGGYGIGGRYTPHVDFSGSEQSGNRLTTLNILLDAPKAGTYEQITTLNHIYLRLFLVILN